MLTAEQRRIRSRVAAHTKHARHDPHEAMAVARAGFRESFVEKARAEAAERGETISDAEARRRGEQLFKAHMARLSLASVKARRKKVS
jgi:hypothetical protein